MEPPIISEPRRRRFDLAKVAGYAIPFLALTAAFYANAFGTVDDSWFQYHQRDSEALAVTRIAAVQQRGFGFDGAFMVIPQGNNDPLLYQSFLEGRANVDRLGSYVSQIGAHGSVMGMVASAMNLSGEEALRLFWLVNSVILAAMMAFFVQWVRRIYGAVPALIVFAFILGAPYLTVFARNLYWVAWTWFLPFFVFLWLAEKPRFWTRRGLIAAFVLGFGLSVLKSSTGYEYISTVFIAAITPIVFYSFYPGRREWRASVSRIFLAGTGLVLGFLFTVAVHLAQMSRFLGGSNRAKAEFHSVFARRMGGDSAIVPTYVHESLAANHFSVIWTYLDSKYVFFGLTALGLIVFSILAFALARVKLRAGEIDSARLPSLTALGASLVVGFLAPMSWFVLAKPHSYVHPQMNFVLWYLPFGLLAAVAIAVLAEEFLRSIVEVSRVRPVIIAMLVMAAAVLVVRQERDYRRVARDCWGSDASVARRNGAEASLNPVRKEVCLRYSSFDVFSEGDITVDYVMSDKSVRSERARILDNYFRLPLWRGRDVVVAAKWPSGAAAPVVIRRLKSDGGTLDEWYLPELR